MTPEQTGEATTAHPADELDDPVAELMLRPRFADDPVAGYQHLQQTCPVARSAGAFGGSGVTLSRYDDVMWALKHPEVFSSKDVVQIGNEVPLIPLSVDPPDHAKYRRMLDLHFAPRKMAELEPEMRALANAVIDEFVEDGGCNFHDAYATPLPSTFFLALMGLPQHDLDQFLRWRDETIRPDARTPEEAQERREAAGRAITAYFEAAIEARRAEPDDRLISTIVHGEVDGRPMTHAEMLGTCHLMLLGGLDTVTATLDCMVTHLARHPEQRRALVDDPSLVPAAVEELLRHETPVMMIPRIVARDVEIGGVTCRAGDSAVLLIGAADVDPTVFDAADEVRFDRERNRHVAFGGGPHRCLGSHLARLELRIALEELHARIPDYELAPGADPEFSVGIRQAEHLPLVFTPGTRRG